MEMSLILRCDPGLNPGEPRRMASRTAAQPHAGTAAILRDELNAGGFKGGLHLIHNTASCPNLSIRDSPWLDHGVHLRTLPHDWQSGDGRRDQVAASRALLAYRFSCQPCRAIARRDRRRSRG